MSDAPGTPVARVSRALAEPVPIWSLVFFRITFGGLLAFEVARYGLSGRFHELWIAPEFHFKYLGFGWVHDLPDAWMVALWTALGTAAVGVMLGLFYRLCAAVTFLGWTYFFLLEQAKYMNHFYLICLLAFWGAVLPCHRALSLDVARRPALFSATAPAWCLGVLRFQVAVVYVYGGIAKMNADWLLRGEPLRTWLSDRAGLPVAGPLLDTEAAVLVFAWGGLLFDLLIVPALLWKPARPWAFALAVAFHLTNATLFHIGIFPWLAIALTLLFFPPDWPARLVPRFARPAAATRTTAGADAGPPRPAPLPLIFLLAVYAGWQLLMPLRHWLYPGDPSWTEEGHRFAWRMMLRSKDAVSHFVVIDRASGEAWQLEPITYLRLRQYRKMNGRPDMLVQFAHHIAGLMADAGHPGVEVRADVEVALNGRPPAPIISSDTDLAAERRSLAHAGWILPRPTDHHLP